MTNLIKGEEVHINGEWVRTDQYLPDPNYYDEVLCTIEEHYHWYDYEHGRRMDAKYYHTEYLRWDGENWVSKYRIVNDLVIAWLPPISPYIPEVV